MSKLTIIAVVVILAAAAAKQTLELPKAKVTLRALDEDGKPIEGAEAHLSFEQSVPSFGGGSVVPVTGFTDARGEFSGEGHSFNTKGGRLTKKGYYSGSATPFKFEKSALGKWEPWNPTLDVVLKKIINPIPMYARKVGHGVKRVEIPGAGGSHGFDLIESDWVAPHGKGKVNDFRFALERRFVSIVDYEAKLTIGFSNPGDGLRVIDLSEPEKTPYTSRLKLPRLASPDGYTPELTAEIGCTPTGAPYQDGRNTRSYFFRIRTVLNEKDEIVSALYGKIDGDFQLDPINSKTSRLLFTYYLNPTTNDRNLEFDPKRNLFTSLPKNEQVKDP